MAAKEQLICEQLGFERAAIQGKYRLEKEKRVREDGDTQYHEIKEHLKYLKSHDFVDEIPKGELVHTEVSVLIVGAGYGGILAAVRLAEKGLTDIVIVEKGADMGGTWYWNQYPGLRCDVESYIYMPLLEELGYIPPEKYATGSEIKRHIDLLAEKYGLRGKTILQTEVNEMTWDEKNSQWKVRTDREYFFTAKYTITATGNLHTPKLPDIPGLSTFKGHHFHTTRWDYNYTGGKEDEVLAGLNDKRVAVIGTGATSIQVVPAVAKYAKQLYIFQRTPASVNARENRPTDAKFASSLTPGWQRRRQENFNAVLVGAPVNEDLVNDGWTASSTFPSLGSADQDISLLERIQLADLQKMQRIRARVDQIVNDQDTAEKLKPWYGSICKRPCFSDEYLSVFNRTNCTLVDTAGKGVEEITEKGLVANGKEYAVDLIIYCTGFSLPANAWKHTGITITGRDGVNLKDTWLTSGVSTLYGSQIHSFPNYFNISVLQAAVSPNFIYTLQTHAEHIAYVITECMKRDVKSVQPSAEAEQAWTAGIIESSRMMRLVFSNCTPSYFNNEGNMREEIESQGVYAAGASAWAKILEEWREEGTMQGLELEK